MNEIDLTLIASGHCQRFVCHCRAGLPTSKSLLNLGERFVGIDITNYDDVRIVRRVITADKASQIFARQCGDRLLIRYEEAVRVFTKDRLEETLVNQEIGIGAGGANLLNGVVLCQLQFTFGESWVLDCVAHQVKQLYRKFRQRSATDGSRVCVAAKVKSAADGAQLFFDLFAGTR